MSKAAELAALIGSQTALSNRNLIINGAMAVAQRGTSASSKTTTGYFACDRWKTEASGATYDVSQQSLSSSDFSSAPFSHFLRVAVTTGNNNSGVAQKIEASAVRNFKGKKFTASFYAKGTNPNGGSFTLSRFFYDGTNASTSEHTSFTVTSSWQRFEITFDYPDEGSTDLTLNTAMMSLSFLQPNGDTSTNAWTLDITGVQLEVGEQATPFEHRSFADELARCQRYFYAMNVNTTSAPTGTDFILGAAWTSSQVNTGIALPVSMRATPTMSFGNASGAYRFYRDGGNDSFDTLESDAQTNLHLAFAGTSGLSHTAGHGGSVQIRYADGAFINADAEL